MANARTRARSEGPVTGLHENWIDENDPHREVLCTNYSQSETMDDYVVPNFQSRIAQGDVINNPCTYVKTTRRSIGTGSSHIELVSGWRHIEGDGTLTEFRQTYPGSPWVSSAGIAVPSEPDGIQDALKLGALGNVDRSPYSFAEDLAEWRETLRFLRDPLGSLRKLSEAFKKDTRKLLSKKKHLTKAKAIADVWLTYRFALSPLVRSANDLLEAASTRTHRPERRTARYSETWSDFDSAEDVRAPTATSPHLWASSAHVEGDYRAGILYEVSNPLNDWRFKYGLRFKDIPETIWAVMPYSFMVDRSFNISQSMRGLSSFLDPNVEILAAWIVKRLTSVQSVTYTGYDYSGALSISVIPDTIVTEKFTYDRTVWVPEISDLIPDLDIKGLINSSTKVADLSALILQNLR